LAGVVIGMLQGRPRLRDAAEEESGAASDFAAKTAELRAALAERN